MNQFSVKARLVGAGLVVLLLAACQDQIVAPAEGPITLDPAMSMNGPAPAAPAGLETVGEVDIWPWTGRDLAGTTADPINLIFKGDVDVVSLRAALLSLADGDRTAFGFPDAPPFNCTWNDAHGEMQTAYSSGSGWVGSAIQLECGDYAPLRFHIRLFDAGMWVLGAVHFDLLIPDTPQHQVLSWELPQLLVTADFARSGLLSADAEDVALGLPGPVQVIPKAIYDGVPDELKFAVGLPPGEAPAEGVGVPSDGLATVLTVGAAASVMPGRTQYDLSMPFSQLIPMPFCSKGPTDFVWVEGPVEISVSTRVNRRGVLEVHNTLRGDLDITPFDVLTGQFSGPTFDAQISQVDNAGAGPNGTWINAIQLRKALPPGVGFLKSHLMTGTNGLARFTRSEKCN
jgi:hypothetical protein